MFRVDDYVRERKVNLLDFVREGNRLLIGKELRSIGDTILLRKKSSC